MSTAPSSSCCVLLTGSTGFLGKVVLEELLRRREEYNSPLTKIFILVRPTSSRTKQQRSAEERFLQEVASSKCFENLPEKWIECVEVVEGDLTLPQCGIDDEVLHARVCAETTHIINCAACVSFDLPLLEATKANVSTLLNLATLARSCPLLQGMVTTSTAYVAPHSTNTVRPDLAPLPYPAALLYRLILAGKIDESSLLRETRYPNTYTLTKSLAEHLLLQQRYHASPIAGLKIVRPSIISCSLKYPSPGWIDSRAAVAGLIALIGSGYLRVVDGCSSARADVVPVDVVAGDIIHAAGLVTVSTNAPPPVYVADKDFIELGKRDTDENPIIHSVASLEKSLPIALIASKTTAYFASLHTQQEIKTTWLRKPKLTYLGPRNLRYHVHEALSHRLPFSLAALQFHVRGNGEMERKTRALAKVVRKINRIFPYYAHHTFEFEMGECSWVESIGDGDDADVKGEEYLDVILEGVRRNLLKI